MTDQKLFGVLARIVGLIIGIYGILEWLVAIGQLVDPKIPHRYLASEDFFFGLIGVLIGLALIRWTDRLTDFAYRRDPRH